MRVDDYNYDLPQELIAQTPIKERSSSRLLVLNKKTGAYQDKHFYDIVDLLTENDCLVFNNTKVIPSRIYGVKEDTKASIELLLLKELSNNVWEALVKNARKVHIDTVIVFGNGLLKAKCIEVKDEGIRVFQMIYEGIFLEILDKIGEMPLPPYIHQKLQDKDRYQTVYAKIEGSAAAPTAGLHFTEDILEKLKAKGVELEYITLHVGLGTFRPVMVENIEDHIMHSEFYVINAETAKRLNEAKAKGKRIISVGTTSTRTLEANYTKYGMFKSTSEATNIFIYPPYDFKAIDALITNFHLPKSTLLMLVSSLAGKENILNAYHHAIEEKYRFFSFGDAMFIN